MAEVAEDVNEGPASRPTIVVADDAPGVLELMAQVLATAAGRVVTARDGEAALRAIREHRPRDEDDGVGENERDGAGAAGDGGSRVSADGRTFALGWDML